MKIYFVRHGESEANVLHVISNRDMWHPLTQVGEEQAHNLAAMLKTVPVTKIYSSPVLRARQTTEILCGTLGLSYEVTAAIREFDCGTLEGKGDEETWGIFNRLVKDWILFGKLERRIDQGESFLDIQARFVPFIQRLTFDQGNSDSAVVLVSHGGIYRCMLPLVLANISKDYAVTHPIGNTAYILAESTPQGLVCREWCGERIPVQ